MAIEQRPQRHKTKERREEILRIASKLFADKGYDGASLNDVASQMGISKAALYHHIQNKEEILREIIEGKLNQAIKDTRQIVNSDLSPKDKLRWFIRAVVKGITTDRYVMRNLFENTASLSEDAKKAIIEHKKAFDHQLQLLLEEGMEKGYFHIDNVKMAVFVIQGACNFCYQWYHDDGKLSPEEIAENFICLLERGYLERNSDSPVIQMQNRD
ncbi:MAG: TetR/AcrR family transcriptional regulator [Dehalococcoidia bacterium]